MTTIITSRINATYDVRSDDDGVRLLKGDNEVTPMQLERLTGNRTFRMHRQNGYARIWERKGKVPDAEEASDSDAEKVQKKPKKQD